MQIQPKGDDDLTHYHCQVINSNKYYLGLFNHCVVSPKVYGYRYS